MPLYLKRILRVTGALILLLLVLIIVLVAPIDDTPLADQPFYSQTLNYIDTTDIQRYKSSQQVRVGWSEHSIVPEYPMPLAGYRPRDKFQEVHDSLYMKVLAIDNGTSTAYIITADLLLFPPVVKDLIFKRLGDEWKDFVYFSATHTHTGVGGWDESILGSLLMGQFDSAYVSQIADTTIDCMRKAKANMEWAAISYWEQDMPSHIRHRINSSSMVDSKFRGLKIVQNNGGNALLYVLGAHPTSISKRFTYLSADYPAAVARELQEYEHVQFMAGSIGSQSFKGFGEVLEWDLVDSVGRTFARYIRKANDTTELSSSVEIKAISIPIAHGKSQLRLTRDLKLRDWVFQFVSKPLKAELHVLQIGTVLFVGTSSDFAGEVDRVNALSEYARMRGLQLIITSFNGEYTGYITADHHYFVSNYEEVRILNWVGPYFGQYYSEMIKKVIDRVSED